MSTPGRARREPSTASPRGRGKVLYRAQDTHVTALAWGDRREADCRNVGARTAARDRPGQRSSAGSLRGAGAGDPARRRGAHGGDLLRGSREPDYRRTRKEPPPEEKESEEPPDGRISQSSSGTSDGTVRELWQSGDETVHALALDADGNLLVGTGSEAGSYRITPVGKQTLLWRPEEGQVLSILPPAGRSSWERATQAGSTSSVRTTRPRPGCAPSPSTRHLPHPGDTRSGRRLPGSGRWEMVTRSGHTQAPDSSWSAWSAPLTDPEGSAITSPPARFLQVEARFHAVRRRLAGEPPPDLVALQLRRISHRASGRFASARRPDGPAREGRDSGSYTQDLGGGLRAQFQRARKSRYPRTIPDGPPVWVRDVRSIAWDATDPDGDDLRAELGIRRVGEPDSAPRPQPPDERVRDRHVDACRTGSTRCVSS